MSMCPFLSTDAEIVNCFSSCSFYEEDNKGESCPFNMVYSKKHKSKNYDVFYYENMAERSKDDDSVLNLYVDKKEEVEY